MGIGKRKGDYTLNQLMSAYKCKMGTNNLLFLTPEVLDELADDELLKDIYGKIKTKAQFTEDRKGKLYPSRQGGVTIYGFEWK